MKHRGLAGLLLPTIALSLSACSSAPVHYYTLLAPTAPPTQAEQPAPFLIDVLPVGIPVQLDQPQMVVRQGDSGIVVLDGQRWVGPLGDELRSALSAELSRLLGSRDVAGLPKPADQAVLSVKLQVRRLDAWPGHKVQLDADWSLGLGDKADSTRLLCGGRFDEPAEGGYPELVQAQQRAIAALALRIAADARAWAGSHAVGCTAAKP